MLFSVLNTAWADFHLFVAPVLLVSSWYDETHRLAICSLVVDSHWPDDVTCDRTRREVQLMTAAAWLTMRPLKFFLAAFLTCDKLLPSLLTELLVGDNLACQILITLHFDVFD